MLEHYCLSALIRSTSRFLGVRGRKSLPCPSYTRYRRPFAKYASSTTGEQDLSGFELRQYGKDDPPRLTCKTCSHILYDNPKIVTGAVVTSRCPQTGDSLFLLCRRAIPPRRGFFNLCAGYMEKGESLAEAAAREAREEAGAQIEIGQILGIFDISHIGQVHIYFKATLSNTDIKAGYESLDARLVRWDEIPWGDLAFPTVSWALMAWEKQAALGGKWGGTPFRNPVLSEYEGSTNVWYRPDKGGLVHDESWMRREGREESVGSAGERQGKGGAGECQKSAQETHERNR